MRQRHVEERLRSGLILPFSIVLLISLILLVTVFCTNSDSGMLEVISKAIEEFFFATDILLSDLTLLSSQSSRARDLRCCGSVQPKIIWNCC